MTREEAKERLKTDIYKYADFKENPNEDEFWMAFDMAIKALEQEPKTGHWIDINDIEAECSECGHREPNERFIFEDINFCAKCGAKMIEPQERVDKE